MGAVIGLLRTVIIWGSSAFIANTIVKPLEPTVKTLDGAAGQEAEEKAKSQTGFESYVTLLKGQWKSRLIIGLLVGAVIGLLIHLLRTKKLIK
jgi:F0F1-type ATP synthase assembly protein I